MKISLNWIKDEYIKFTSTPEVIESNLTALGLECNIEKDKNTYDGIVLGKILEVDSIEKSDHLKLCEVDIGTEVLNIVCGADNVKSNILVPVAPIGASLGNGSFIIKKVKLCGQYSYGMICSEKELGISSNHDGIMTLDSNKDLGTPIKDILSFDKNIVLDIDLTPNRGDCLSHIGVAREIKIFDDGHSDILTNNNSNSFKVSGQKNIDIEIKNKDACRRYCAVIIKGIKVGSSPDWLRKKLNSIGQKSINNIVDIANYAMFNNGHPLHVFDLSKVQGQKIKVRYADEGEKIVTLDNKERTLSKDHLLICDDIKPIAIAGIMGALNSEVTEDTRDILIESAYFDPTVIRRGAKKLDLSTEASKRFERDTDIEGSLIDSLDTLVHHILDIAGGQQDGFSDKYPNKKDKKIVSLSIDKCNEFLGTQLTQKDFENILNKLLIDFDIKDNIFSCTIPLYRNDLLREIDLYEEVARVFGYDNIPVKSNFTIPFDSIKNDEFDMIDRIKRYFSDFGFNEHYSNSLFHLNKINLFNKKNCVKISNPLSNEMEYLRDSILPGIILASSYNEKRMNSHYKLFEVGSIHWIESKDKYLQENSIGLLWSDNMHKHWRDTISFDLSMVKGELSSFFSRLGFGNSVIYDKIDNDSFSITIDNSKVGTIYLLNKKMIKLFQISNDTIVAELNLDILTNLSSQKILVNSPSNYPSSSRDIALLVDRKIKYVEVENDIKKSGGDLLNDIILFDIYEGEDLGNENRSLAISLKFMSNERTLKDKEIDGYVDNILNSLKKNFKIQQR